jgi:HlyD family secretion protein
MDIQRTIDIKKRRIRRILIASAVVMGVAAITVGLSRLKPAAPQVERATVYMDTVKRGDIPREVRGNGTLVPQQIQLVQARTEGRVEQVLVLAGAAVKADTILMELSNPELQQAALEAEWQLKAAEAQLQRLKVQLESDRLTQEAATATLKTEYTLAAVDAETDAELSKSGLVPGLTLKKSIARADELKSRYGIEVKRLNISSESAKAQIAVQEADLAKLRAMLELKRQQVAALQVRPGIDGVLQQVGDKEMLQAGQRVMPGATLAKVVQPTKLKAEIKIAETQAKDLLLGQSATIDTHNGVVTGEVMRIDPAALNGTVTVDVMLKGPLPKGARPDMNVEGTVLLERLQNVLYVGRPINGQPESTVGLFKVVSGGKEAVRVPVKLGRGSVNTIEIINGLEIGDQVILSDMSQWDAQDRVRLN